MTRGSPDVRVTVAVPVKNGARHLEDLLAALAAQEVPGGMEVLAVDSGSTDGSAQLLENRGARLLRISPEAFDHGVTRNVAAQEARGAVVVFLSQDAVPADRHCVRRLVEALDSDPRLAGAFARQQPRPEADPLTRRDLGAWVASQAVPRRVFVSEPARFEALAPLERYLLAAFDNVASAVRRDLLLLHPFAPTRFGEDLEWAHRMLRLGYGLAYAPEAVVVHSHPRSARSLYRRNYLGHRLLMRLFGLRTIPDRLHLLRACAGGVASDVLTLARAKAAPNAWLAAPVQAVAAAYGQYRGARDEARGRAYPRWA
jgi:rhamnosyltransferase